MDAVEVPEERHNGKLSNLTITGEAGKIHSGAMPYQLSCYMDYTQQRLCYATGVRWHL